MASNPKGRRATRGSTEAPVGQPTFFSEQAGAVAAANPHAGHRQRLRERFAAAGPEALPDYELLEMVLFRVYRRRDTKALAKRLLAQFGSFNAVINAPPTLLLKVEDAGQAIVDEFLVLRTVAQRLAKSAIIGKPALGSWNQVLDYLKLMQAYEHREQFRILFMDKRNVLIADEVQGQGTIDHTPVYVREVVKRALELSASALILVHNHPSGDPTPSRADIDMTRLIVDAAKPLGIAIHDHIIVGKQGHASIKALRLM